MWGNRLLAWLGTEIKSPPFSEEARIEAGSLLRRVQEGEKLSMPDSRPMPQIGPRCHELRIRDSANNVIWRIIYRLDPDVVVIAEVFCKKTQNTPQYVIKNSQRRLKLYDEISLER
ncbi:MAG: type II toxin-antitoxin system RelE/ParE family toxin [Anaerolineae bacterium]|nr:type II toxin-antitoxin system RelE/ParE family toxin [Anaerolineae bacterium]